MWRVEPRKSATRQVERLARPDRARIAAAINAMADDPFAGDVVRLKGEGGLFRRRVGDYRIFFEVDRAERLVIVHEVVRRTSTTY